MNALLAFIRSFWLAITAVILMTITALSLWPLETLPQVPGGDKFHHFIAYAALMFPAALRKPKYLLFIGLFFIAWGGVIELIQPYVNRYASLLDLAANTAGIAFGLLAVKLNFSNNQYELDHG
jgi:VanZ family protein